ncbi:MFS transporter [Micromonospora sp. ATA32]|nr:MFS transporter [Micromonospora sp. ATA32]
MPTRTLFAAAILLFIVGTALAVVAPGFSVVLLARIIQAAGTAIILPLLMTTTLTSVPVAYRGTVMGLNSVVISVAPAIGPTLSGVVVDSLGWRWLFGLMLPFALVTFVLGVVLIRATSETVKAPLDVPSVVLSAFAFGGLVYGLASVGAIREGTWAPVAALVVGVAALVVFVARQVGLQQKGKALLDLRPFAVHNFRISVMIVIICMATMLGTVMVLPIYLQTGLGVGVMTTGLLLLPGASSRRAVADHRPDLRRRGPAPRRDPRSDPAVRRPVVVEHGGREHLAAAGGRHARGVLHRHGHADDPADDRVPGRPAARPLRPWQRDHEHPAAVGRGGGHRPAHRRHDHRGRRGGGRRRDRGPGPGPRHPGRVRLRRHPGGRRRGVRAVRAAPPPGRRPPGHRLLIGRRRAGPVGARRPDRPWTLDALDLPGPTGDGWPQPCGRCLFMVGRAPDRPVRSKP